MDVNMMESNFQIRIKYKKHKYRIQEIYPGGNIILQLIILRYQMKLSKIIRDEQN